MSTERRIPLPVVGSQITTACGGEEIFAFDTPRAKYEEGWIFFCTPECQGEFIQDPGSSCLADQIQDQGE